MFIGLWYSNQGSVLAVRVFGSLSIYFTPQPEVVPKVVSGVQPI